MFLIWVFWGNHISGRVVVGIEEGAIFLGSFLHFVFPLCSFFLGIGYYSHSLFVAGYWLLEIVLNTLHCIFIQLLHVVF